MAHQGRYIRITDDRHAVDQCQHHGCVARGDQCESLDDRSHDFYCARHAFQPGYCMVCGQFWGGIESFEFDHRGVCDNCHDQIEADSEPPDDEDYYEPPFDVEEELADVD